MKTPLKTIDLLSRPKKEQDAIFAEVIKQTGYFTVPVVIQGTLTGSGTLVEFDGNFALLTAKHVVDSVWEEKARLFVDGEVRELLLPISQDPEILAFQSDHIRAFLVGPHRDGYSADGPDLALLILPATPNLETLRARKGFLNLGQNLERRMTAIESLRGFSAVCGFPKALTFAPIQAAHFDEAIGFEGLPIISGFGETCSRGNWDFISVPSKKMVLQSVFNIEADALLGMSGGGIWRALIQEVGDGFQIETVILNGVFFGQKITKDEITMIGHGPKSIFIEILDRIRNQGTSSQILQPGQHDIVGSES